MFDYVYENKQINFDDTCIQDVYPLLPKIEDIKLFVPLIWQEHCLECSAPACYTSCELFEADRYGRCQRTKYGVITKKYDNLLFPLTQLCFKKWGKLRCRYNSSIGYEPTQFLEQYDKYIYVKELFFRLGKIFNFMGPSRKDLPARLVHHNYIKKYAPTTNNAVLNSEGLFLAFYSLSQFEYKLLLDAYDKNSKLLSRNAFTVNSGFNIWQIHSSKLNAEAGKINALELYPHNNAEAELIFFYSDLITFKHNSEYYKAHKNEFIKSLPAPKAKCVVWDLDNTLWNGIIGDDGLDCITLREGIKDIIIALDKRGVLQSICSKNDYEPAWAAIKKFELEDYFLYPQINWNNKSSNLLNLSKTLNIGIDTFVFIDDSRIEREEVASRLTNVRIYSEKDIDTLLTFPEFDLSVTEDSVKRRRLYISGMNRSQAFEADGTQSYKEFIQSCHFKIQVSRCMTDGDVNRCHELFMRTNQLNTSTNRIPFDEFCEIVKDNGRIVLKMKCEDDFGEYGTVGCLILKNDGDKLLCTDFVISCRVAGKKVESAIISFIMDYYESDLNIVFVQSERNHVIRNELIAIGGEYNKDEQMIMFKRDAIIDNDWTKVFIDLLQNPIK